MHIGRDMEDKPMSTHHTKTLTLVLMTFLAMNLPSGAQGQGELPGMEPLEGIPAKLDNEQDFLKATTAFDDGMLALESALLNEGLRRAIKIDEDNRGFSAYAKPEGQINLEEAAKALRSCKDSCETPEEKCRDHAGKRSNILRAISCEIELGRCQVNCTRNLLATVSRMPDSPSDTQAQENEDPAMAQQREEAVKAVLLFDFKEAQNTVEQGLLDLQNVAFEEGIRTTLEEYDEYGVPPGETRLVTATKDILECQKEVEVEQQKCEEADGFLGDLACGLAATVDDLACIGSELVDRYL